VLVEVTAGNVQGLGYTYADTATAQLIKDKLAEVVLGCDAMAVPRIWAAMVAAIRNLGRPGIASMAIAAVDAALWDVKARLLGVPLVTLLGAVRDSVPVYGSGGFTSYTVRGVRVEGRDYVIQTDNHTIRQTTGLPQRYSSHASAQCAAPGAVAPG
jgi:L-alanine-DL-glutamate epimerase-like enolase superfamily enzyme